MEAHIVHGKARTVARRHRPASSMIDGVHGVEINWDHVPRIIAAAESWGVTSFVYFVVEEGGLLKIGRASNPIKRRRALQTGNPRHLRIERLIFGDAAIERMLHEYWRAVVVGSAKTRNTQFNGQYSPETEWFSTAASPKILDIAAEIADRQLADCTFGWEDFTNIITEVHSAHGHDRMLGDTVRLLAKGIGYAHIPLRRPA